MRTASTTLACSTIALLPLFEAVVNAIQSVDVAHAGTDTDRSRITVEVHRTESFDFDPEFDPTRGQRHYDLIIGFTVRDNGEGFHDANMRSFQTLDTDYKAGLGCRST
jgi:hypothetical protein